LLDAVQAAGYDRSFDLLDRSSERAARSTEIIDWHAIELDETNRTVRLPRGMRLDFGGVAKGWAADQATRRLGDIAPALVDAGGDIALSGARMNEEAWSIAVADPFKPDSDLELLLMVYRGGVATSGRDYRKWQRDGKWQHHIIDPRTGASAKTDVLSATVIAPTTQDAEVAAKAALILGSRAGLEWLEARENLAGLMVLDDSQVIHSSRLHNYFWSEPVEQISNLPY
jgi:thiamine biosynthesis lipoprotein